MNIGTRCEHQAIPTGEKDERDSALSCYEEGCSRDDAMVVVGSRHNAVKLRHSI
jgi:hypothetical protein